MTQEKRKNPRVTIKPDDGLMAVFALPDENPISGSIVTLSRDGIGLLVSKKFSEQIEMGTELFLKQIIGTTHLEFLGKIQAEVMWIKDLGYPDMVNVGCEFKEMSKESDEQLSQFVNMERKFRGQYD